MNETPRLRSAFPSTPQTNPRLRTFNNNARSSLGSSPLFPQKTSPLIKQPVKSPPEAAATGAPLVSTDVVDIPSQRFYVFAFYVALTAWRLYNAYNVENDLDSTWLFLKWVGMDAAFFVALPAFKIPWLEFSFLTTFTLWFLHVVTNAFLMYKIPIPILAWLGALVRVAYDRELSISEHRVKPADILYNSSIILGKQIIHILPEGSAIFNPDKLSFCLDAAATSVELPLQINQTTPISVELHRFDLDTDEVETIMITSKQLKSLKKKADSGHHKSDTKTPRVLHYPVSKRGLYQLHRVIDTTKLEVRRRSFDLAVVQCPRAGIAADTENRCTGELSDVRLHVSGVPPFKVKYRKSINHKQQSSIVQNVQPRTESDSGMEDGESAGIVMDLNRPQMGWTKATAECFDINESLHQNGSHSYAVEEVEDGLGNKVIYDASRPKDAHTARVQTLTVHNRPRISFTGLDADRLLRVKAGSPTHLPIRVQQAEKLPSTDWPLKLKYVFESENEQETSNAEEHTYELIHSQSAPFITLPGQYRLQSIDSPFCHGEVTEPSTCLLSNPPKPGLTLESEDIFDKCAGNPIGMIVNFDFTGSPPFKIKYTTTHNGHVHDKYRDFAGMRGQIELRESSAGSYTYKFVEVTDSVYGAVSVKDQNLILKQDIRPPASAVFRGDIQPQQACLGSTATVQVRLSGQAPWGLDYEIIHNGKRKKHSIQSEHEVYTIELPPFSDGGSYSVVLMGVQDQSKCRTTLQEERKISVRQEQPQAAFGDIDGKRSILALDGKSVNLPLRLKGFKSWAVRIQNIDDGTESVERHFKDANAELSVDRPGTYEIVSVHDSCPGVVDSKANKFTVSWIPRPTLSIKESGVEKESSNSFRVAPVCQGEDSSIGLALTGNAPFHVKYQQKFEPIKGQVAISNKPGTFSGKDAHITLDTAKAGEYTYVFSELGDARYTHDSKAFSPFMVKQQVYAPPSAKFSQAGKTYGYCKDDPSFTSSVEAETEKIPITFAGTPPFSVEIAITHHGVSTRPEIIRQRDIHSINYEWPLSRATLDLGTHAISIRSIKDGRGCETILDTDTSSVRVHVSSPPTIIPLSSQEHYCVGEHVSFSLSGQSPFDVFYTFGNRERKARVTGTEFRRLAESPGEFMITGVSDAAMGSGKCRARKEIMRWIHPFPSVEIAQGKTMISDIHEGGEVDIEFRFTGTPPFEFTYTRSENPSRSKKGAKSRILETRHDASDTFSKMIRASDEGIYEVVSIKDRFCSYAKPAYKTSGGNTGQKKLTY